MDFDSFDFDNITDLGLEDFLFGYYLGSNRLQIAQLVVGALVFLNVVAWVDVIFFDLKLPEDVNNPNADRSRLRRNRFLYTIFLTLITIVAVILYNWFNSSQQKKKRRF